MASIPTNFNFPTSRQVPDHAILDQYNKQAYLGNYFHYVNSSTVAGTSETALILFSNASTNGVSAFINYKKGTCLTASHSSLFNFYLSPTVSANGTAVTTVINTRPAMSKTSVMSLYTGPTASPFGTLTSYLMSQTQAPDESASSLIVLDPGQSLLVTVTVSNALGWFEL